MMNLNILFVLIPFSRVIEDGISNPFIIGTITLDIFVLRQRMGQANS